MQKQTAAQVIFSITFFVLFAAGCRGTAAAKIQPAASPQLAAGPATIQDTATATAIPTVVAPQPAEPSATAPAPDPTATLSPTADTSQPVQQTCTDELVFLEDVTIPDYSVLSPAQSFTKTWRVRNAGSCNWKGYRLSFMSGELLGANVSIPAPAVAPGEDADLSVPMTAPADPGGYTGNWQLLDGRGQPVPVTGSDQNDLWIKITVSAPQPTAQLMHQPTPAASVPAAKASSPAPSNSFPGCASAPDGTFENAVLTLINQERASRNLPPLKREARLDTAALQHSLDMSCNNFVEHYGSSGSTWFTRITESGYAYQYASENIAAGNPAFGGDANWVVEVRWMNSQVHRDNILNPKVTQIGISYVYNSAAQWGGYTTVDFALP